MDDFARYLNIRSATAPVPSPNGGRVAFLSDTTGNDQVWSVSTRPEQTAWPQQLTFFPDKVWEIHGTPAAAHLVAVSDSGGNERQQFYLIDNYGDLDNGHTVRRLTDDDHAIHRFGAWSRNGQLIAYTSNARNSIDFDCFVLDMGSGVSRLVQEGRGNRSVLAWSPDERFLLIADNVGSLQDDLYLLDLSSGGLAQDAERYLTAGFYPARYWEVRWTANGVYLLSDRTHDRGALCRLDTRSGDLEEVVSASALPHQGEMELLAVARDGHTAALSVNADGYSHLYLLDLRHPELRPVSGLPPGVAGHLAFHADGSHLVFDLQGPDRNPDVWQVATTDGACRPQTFSDRAGIPARSFVVPELVHFPAFDDLEIPALYYRPQSPTPAAGAPCILYVHGGPASQIRPDFDVRFQYLLSQGYAILAPNVRGSTGYGREYTMLDEIELRMDSVADLKQAVDWLHTRPEIDGRRIAIYGRSYGGFMVLAALTAYPDLFAAGIDVVGIANWVTFLERTSAWRRSHREREYGSLAGHRELLEQISPIHKAERIRVPLLVVAGDNDPRVPLSESEQVVSRVQAAGGTVSLIHYGDEGHKISKLANRIDSFNRMAQFLREYV